MELTEEDLQIDLDRRKPGMSRHTTQRRESDEVKILSGVFEGKTTGVPIALLINNTDQRSKDYSNIKDQFRPGHADYTYYKKYGLRDYRGGGRSSARETAMRVAAGGIAKKYLKEKLGIEVKGYLSQVSKVKEMEDYMDALRKEGESIGAKITTIATGVPPGLGEPIFDRLDAEICHSMMSINAAKGVEIGAGFDCITQKGTVHRDEIYTDGFDGNNAGGILGGISSGQDIVVNTAFKATSSLRLPGQSVNIQGEPIEVVTKGRHDPCVGIRATPICEAQLAMTLMDHVLRHRAQNIDVTTELADIPASKK
ncbi:UNVERIFIED_CONTAM: hypothetical protein GTU68_065297 [Idotea baltica]|nr:hypothetical protein [Idotea baltica]